MSRNRSLLISEVGKIVRLLLLSQATNAKTDGIFSALKCVKTSALMLLLVHNDVMVNINLVHETAAKKGIMYLKGYYVLESFCQNVKGVPWCLNIFICIYIW